MQPAFDPYYRWLGIPAEEQPPNYYLLLGLRVFEADRDVIESAADRQMRHVQTFKTGQHSAQSQSLLNEIAAARLCLLAPAKKAAYDSGLKAAIPAPPPMHVPVAASVPRAVAVLEAAPPVPLINTDRGSTGPHYRSQPRRANSGWTMLAVGMAAIGVFVAAAWLVWRSRPIAPQLPAITNQALDEGQTLSLNLAPADLPQRNGQLVFELLGGSPSGVQLDRDNGKLTWTPEEAHGPGKHKIGVRGSVAGSPHLYDEASFEVLVAEVHQPPQLDPIALRQEGRRGLSARLVGRDLDLPHRGKVTYSLQVTPTPAAPPTMSPDGQFVWRPASADLGKSFELRFRVSKAGMPQFFSEQTLKADLPNGEGFGRAEFAAGLDAAGAAVQYAGPVVSALFGGRRHSYRVDQKTVDVTEYASIPDASATVAQLRPEAGRFGELRINYTAPTHFFHKERLLAVYAGNDASLLERLKALMGDPIGVGRPATPGAATDPTLTTTPPPPPIAPKPRLPVPEARVQAKDLETIRKIYEERYDKLKNREDRLALAKTLYAKALEMADSPSERFAMFLESHELAAAAGDVAQAWQAVEILAGEYEFDAFDAKLAALKKVVGAGHGNVAEHLEAAQRYWALIELAAQQERFDDALSLIQPAFGAARRSQDTALADRIKKRHGELIELKKAFDKTNSPKKVDSPPARADMRHGPGSRASTASIASLAG